MIHEPSVNSDPNPGVPVAWDWRDLVIPAGIFGLAAGINIYWLALNDKPPMWDSALHLANALEYLKAFRSGALTPEAFLGLSPYYPPLFYLLLAPILLVRPAAGAACLIHLPFLLILATSVYYLGRRLIVARSGAALAALLAVLYPHVQWLGRDVMIDLEVISLTALLVALAVASESFNRFGPTVVLGLAAGASLLTKWTIALYAFPALLWLLVSAWWATPDKPQRLRAVNNLLTGLLAGGLLAWPWYMKNVGYLATHFVPYTQELGKVEGDPGLWTLNGWLFYTRALLGWHLFGFFFLLLIIALGAAILRRMPGRGLLLAWIGGPYLIFSLFANKAPRHIAPVLPAVALLTAWFITGIRPVLPRRILAGAAVMIALAQAWSVGFGLRFLPQAVNLAPMDAPAFQERSIRCGADGGSDDSITNWPDGWFLYNQQAFGIWGPPSREDWKIEAILGRMEEAGYDSLSLPVGSSSPATVAEPLTLALVPDCARFNVWSFRCDALARKVNAVVWRVSELNDGEGSVFDPYQFVVVKDGPQGPAWNTGSNGRLCRFVRARPERFPALGEWPLPDGSLARLYRNLAFKPERRPPDSPWPF